MSEKVQKVLARAGFGSRREIEEWIKAGRIKINHNVAQLGARIEVDDRVALDGKPLSSKRLFAEPQRVLMYHKNVGTVCTRSDPEGRKTVFQDLPKTHGARWVLVGRLDINTSGLLLVTTDGELANRLMHPSYEIEREYLVRVLGAVSPEVTQQLTQGVELEDGFARFERLVDMGGEGANHWYRVVLKEGRNREVRRIWESQGVQVSRLARIRFGPLNLPKSLRRGHYAELTPAELRQIYQAVGLSQSKKVVHQRSSSAKSRDKSGRSASAKSKSGKVYAPVKTEYGKSGRKRARKKPSVGS
jgi:23S rRNA pseudouridine2605 synthase